ncbi:MAG: HDOD domain-containing protein [bacterium]|nr:HDOD domain-containing protein [bacterium]
MNGDDRLMVWVHESIQEHPGELPSFPRVAGSLVSALEQQDVEIAEIESLIHQDQAIAADVIRAANSPIYRGVSSIDRLDTAIMRMGFSETAKIAMASACRSLYDLRERTEFEVFADLWQPLWHESMVCAFGARWLSHKLKIGDDGRVFLGALFRDVGSLLILKTLASGLVRGRLDAHPSLDEVNRVLSTLHASVGADYLRKAGMPDHVIGVAQEHHAADPPLAPDTLELHVIRLSGGLCEQIGISAFSAAEQGKEGAQSMKALEIRPEQYESYVDEFQNLETQVSELF